MQEALRGNWKLMFSVTHNGIRAKLTTGASGFTNPLNIRAQSVSCSASHCSYPSVVEVEEVVALNCQQMAKLDAIFFLFLLSHA
jgi:hypothetical protein